MFKKILEELAEIKQLLQQLLSNQMQSQQEPQTQNDDKKAIDDAFKLKNGLYSFKKQKKQIKED